MSDIDVSSKYNEILRENAGDILDAIEQSKHSLLNFNQKKEATDHIFFKAKNLEQSYKFSENIMADTTNLFNIGPKINLFQNHDITIVNIHGNMFGKMMWRKKAYKPADIIQKLEDANLIPENTRKIYTMSCYGGKQQSGITKGGKSFSSLHTSKEEILFYARPKKQMESMLKMIPPEEQEATKEMLKDLVTEIHSGKVTDEFKQDVIRLHKEHGKNFADIEFLGTQEEVEKALDKKKTFSERTKDVKENLTKKSLKKKPGNLTEGLEKEAVNTAKKLNSKTIGIAAGIGIGTLVLGGAIMSGKKKKHKEEDKDNEEENKKKSKHKASKNTTSYTNKDLKHASNISQFGTGHSEFVLRG